MTLFIDYANTDLRKNPEFLLKILEYLDWHSQKVEEAAGNIISFGDPPLEDPVYFHMPVGHGRGRIREICKKLISDYEALKGHLDEACPTSILYHAVNIKWLDDIDLGAVIKICACEGAFYWAMHAHGCRDECKYNMLKERDSFNKLRKNACFICDWLAFREILSDWAVGDGDLLGHHDLIEAFNTINHKEGVIRKDGSLETYEFLSLIDSKEWLGEPQRFSQIVMAVLWHDINRFLSREKAKKDSPDPVQLIKQCRICEKFFIADRSNATNCDDCKGKETPEAWRNRQQKYRLSKESKYSGLYDRGKKFGLSHADVVRCLEHWEKKRGYTLQDITDLPDTTIFSFE